MLIRSVTDRHCALLLPVIIGFWSQFFCFVLKNEEWGFLKTLFWKLLHSYVLYWKRKQVFEVNFFLLFWKIRISKNSSEKYNILMYCIDKLGFWSWFFCIKRALEKYNIYLFISNSIEDFKLKQYRKCQPILPMRFHFMRYFVNSIISRVSHRLLYCVFIEVDFEK